MTPCVGFINSVLYVYKGPPLCTKTSGTLSEPDPAPPLTRLRGAFHAQDLRTVVSAPRV